MEDLYPRIEDYLGNALTNAERTAFEAEAQADPALAAALALARETRERLAQQWAQENADAALRKTLTNLEQQHFGQAKPLAAPGRRASLSRWWMAAAAAIAVLVVWMAWPPGKDALYERCRKFPEASFTVKSIGGQTLGEAAKLFNTKKFGAALPILNAHLEQHPADVEVRFFAGLSQLELKQLADAETTFRQLLSPENAWSEEARWYLALTHLRGEKKVECREVLRQIPPGGAHHSEAQELLGRIQ